MHMGIWVQYLCAPLHKHRRAAPELVKEHMIALDAIMSGLMVQVGGGGHPTVGVALPCNSCCWGLWALVIMLKGCGTSGMQRGRLALGGSCIGPRLGCTWAAALVLRCEYQQQQHY